MLEGIEGFEFKGVQSAFNPIGGYILCAKAIEFVAAHYGCEGTLNPMPFLEGHSRWAEMTSRRPLRVLRNKISSFIAVAMLIEAMSSRDFVTYAPSGKTKSVLTGDFPAEVTALVMGIILHDIYQRTARSAATKLHYIAIDQISEEEMHLAVRALRERRPFSYRVANLKLILARFTPPATFH